ncbi:MAG: Asp-tRNA(Asn)/Glu-tRNA(Gln) amidotransferase subunit GatA [candidate division Zixibacteria bacterium]|nr:Asp-tRNA(Asn)/Glu-tRNA(Gln) amidotransferase subunit GatA [candidate division Zixibacteria bacterium]
MTDSPTRWSVAETVERVERGEVTAAAATGAHLTRIEERRSLNAYITVMADQAREQAADIDRKRAAGESLGPLAGVPLAIKDNILVAGVPCTCGSRILRDWIPPYEATVIERLRGAGAVFVGKSNCDEFAMGSTTENSHYGPSRNPHDPERVPGGSSGGSAVAVADFQAVAGLGSDTGGSVRLPAALCGVVGLKPTYGAVSRWGLVAFASSLDQIGVFGRTVADTKAVFDVIRGHDPRDSTSMRTNGARPAPKQLTIGWPEEYYGEGLDAEIRHSLEQTANRLKDSGHKIIPVSLPNSKYTIAVYYVICTAEASSNLARYDGVKYGHRADSPDDLLDMYRHTRAEGFGDEVKRRILLGTYVLSAGYYDAYYGTAQKVRTLIADDFTRAFATVDCLLTPTSPTCAFKLGEKMDDPLAMYLSDIYTTSINLAGLPAVSVPCGTSKGGLPIGAQVIGRPFEEHLILSVAEEIEKHRR